MSADRDGFPVVTDPRRLEPRSGSALERLLFNHRKGVLAVSLIVTAMLGVQASRVRMSGGFEKTLPASHPYVVNYRAHEADLKGAGNAVRIAVEASRGTVFERGYLETLRQINDEVLLIPGVDRPYMKSLWTPSTRWLAVTEEGLEGGPVIPDGYDGSPKAIEQVRVNVERAGPPGVLVASDQRSSMIFVPLLEGDPLTGRPIDGARLARDLEAIRARYTGGAVQLHITGFAQVVGDLIAGLRHMLVFFAVAPALALLALYWYTRSVRCAVLVVACSLMAVVWLLGLLPVLGYQLDPYSLLVPFLIFAIGVSHGAQKMNGISQDIGRGAHRLVAARYTFRRLFVPGLTALLSAVAGFCALAVIPIRAIRELAIAASLGVAALVFTNLILLPVLLSYVGIGERAARRARAAELREGRSRGSAVIRLLARFTQARWAAAAIVAASALAVASAAIRPRLRIGDLDAGAPELRPASRYNRDAAFMASHYAASGDVLVVMVNTSPSRCAAYPTLAAVDALEWRLQALPVVDSTDSLASFSRRSAAALNEGSPKWYDVPRNQALLNSIIAQAPREMVDYGCDLVPVQVHLRDHRAETLNQVERAVVSFAARNDGDGVLFQLAAGDAGFALATNRVVAQASHRVEALVYAAVIALAFLTFRSWRAVLCAILPLALTSLLCEALMVALGIGVKVATLPVVALGVGLGVDYALYVLAVTLARLREGLPLGQAYQQALAFTGKVVVLAGATLSVSVGAWAFSDIKFQADMGKLLAFMFAWNMLGTLVLLPALARFLLGPASVSTAAAWPRRASTAMRAVLGLGAALLVWGPPPPARAFELALPSDLHLRFDNTLKYSTAVRLAGRARTFLDNPNGDDGDRNFAPGFISHRFDLLSELDLTHHDDLGVRASAAGWFDLLYNLPNDNDSPATFNPVSVPNNRFPHATRDLHGRRIELLDGLVFANGSLGGIPANVRAGRHTLLWGESLLLADNGISYAQAPLDLIKALSVPGTQAKELFLPVGQISGQLRPTVNLTLAGFYQFESRRTRLPAAGSYFSNADVLDAGGERLLTMAGAFYRGRDLTARTTGQWGISARYRAERIDTELGLYFINFHERLPQLYLFPGTGVDPAIGKIGEYTLVFPEDIHLVGASFSTAFQSLSLAGEAHARLNTALASTPQMVMPGTAADNRDHPLYAVGDTVHAQVSAVYTLGPAKPWDSALVLAEAGWQGYTSINENRAAFDPKHGRQAFGLQAQFTPTYFAVLRNLDLSVPTSLSYNPWGKGPLAAFNGGVHRGGTAAAGLSAEFRKVWLAALRFSYFFGPIEYQPRRDRHFVSFAAQRTF